MDDCLRKMTFSRDSESNSVAYCRGVINLKKKRALEILGFEGREEITQELPPPRGRSVL